MGKPAGKVAFTLCGFVSATAFAASSVSWFPTGPLTKFASEDCRTSEGFKRSKSHARVFARCRFPTESTTTRASLLVSKTAEKPVSASSGFRLGWRGPTGLRDGREEFDTRDRKASSPRIIGTSTTVTAKSNSCTAARVRRQTRPRQRSKGRDGDARLERAARGTRRYGIPVVCRYAHVEPLFETYPTHCISVTKVTRNAIGVFSGA